MKKVLFFTLCAGVFSAATLTVTAQKDKKDNSQEEIIIRKHGDGNTRLTIEMKDDNILINGKPLSEFNDSSLTVIKRNGITHYRNDKLIRPGGGNSFFYNDDNDNEPRPFLGVTTEKDDTGVKINNVSKGSAAEKAGLKEGDIITKLGDTKIADPEDLTDAVRLYKPKSEIKIYYQRDGKASDTKAILGERKDSRMRAFSFNGDGVDGDMMKDFKFEMPPMPKQPFNNFWMPQNKRLGVKIEDTEDDNGVRISTVETGSAAEKAGLKKDDIITEVDGNKVTNTDEAREKVLENEKSSYTIKAKRGTTEMSFQIKNLKKIKSANL